MKPKHWVNMGVSIAAIAGIVALTIWGHGEHVETLIALLVGLQIPGSNAEQAVRRARNVSE